ncbi:hypothetical protein ACWEO4_47205 [Streptomyces sp. NPDC004393]
MLAKLRRVIIAARFLPVTPGRPQTPKSRPSTKPGPKQASSTQPDHTGPARTAKVERLSVNLGDSVAMFGRSGEWTYVLEVERSTWHLVFLDRLGQDTLVEQGDELVCLDRFLHEHPWVCYVDAAGEVSSGEPGDSLLEAAVPPGDRLGAFAALDAAMRRAGAVRNIFPGCEDPEDEDAELAKRLFAAVGEHLGLSLPRREIELGLLPAVHLPSPV